LQYSESVFQKNNYRSGYNIIGKWAGLGQSLYFELDRGDRQTEMFISEELVDIIKRIGSDTHTEADLQRLRQLFGAAVATGTRSIDINRDANGAMIATGDGNTILNIIFQADDLQIEEKVSQGNRVKGLESILEEILRRKVSIDCQKGSIEIVGDKYSYRDNPDVIRRIVQEELNSPHIEHLAGIHKGLNTLAQIADIPKIRDATIVFRTDFKAACEQIQILWSYKALHDLLHRVEFECYKGILNEEKRFPNDLTSLETLEEYGLVLQSIVNQLDEIVNQKILVTQEILWIRELEQAHSEFNRALSKKDSQIIRRSIHLLQRILIIHPSRINTHLNAAAQTLRIPSLIHAMREIFQHLNSSDLSLDQISQFQQGVEALDNLQVRLMSLVMVHDSWQIIDLDLRQLEVNLDLRTDELIAAWPYLKHRIDLVCDCNADDWSIGFYKDSQNLEVAITTFVRDSSNVKRYFRLYRRRAGERFYQIDTALKRLCDELQTICEPIAAVLRIIT
jgi:Effector-associated domain 10